VSVVPLPTRGDWLGDARDGGRALRVSWHTERGCVVLSSWRDDACVATVRLSAPEAARLVAVLGEGLAALLAADGSGTSDGAGTVAADAG
jgi:hypothetical protein